MRGRLLVVGAGAAVAVAVWLAGRGDTADRARRPPGGADPTRAGAAAASDDADRPAAAGKPLRRRGPAPAPKQAVTVGGITLEGAGVYDPESDEVKANLLAFRKSRLRFVLTDAAADCWDGGDDLADLQVRYTMVVEREVLRLENLAMVDSTLPDPALERCILGRLAELRAPVAELDDLREDGSSWISLHDLHTRNVKRQR